MKKITIFFIAFFLLGLSLNLTSQKIRDKSLWAKYIGLPSKILPDDYKTYSVSVNGALFYSSGTSSGSAKNSIKMHGFKKLSGVGKEFGHLRLRAYAGRVISSPAELKKRTTSSKDKKTGKVTKTTYYKYEYHFSRNGGVTIYDPEGKILVDKDASYGKTYTSTEYTNYTTLKKQTAGSFNKHKNSFYRDAVSSIVSSANGALKIYDYVPNKNRHELYIIKKHASEDRYLKHYEAVKEIFAKAKADTPTSELLASLAPSIEFYEGQASKNPKGDKKLKRIYRAANYNLGILYLYTDQLDKSIEYFERVIASEKKDKKSERFIKKVKEYQSKLKKANINTMHFHRDLSDVKAPADIAQLEEMKEKIAAESNSSSGIVYKGKEMIEGTMNLDKNAADFIFGEGGNVKFILKDDAEMNEIDLTNADVSKFVIADRKFSKIRFSPSAKGKKDASVEILEEIYASDKITLYKYYPSSGALSDEKSELAFQKTGQEFPISLESTEFLLWKKGLAKYFSDCPDLSEMCTEGGITNSKEDLIKAARIYSELCEVVIKP